MSLPTDDLREKITAALIDNGYVSIDTLDAYTIADAILALLPKPTDDVKALIEEARKAGRMLESHAALELKRAATYRTEELRVCKRVIDRLAAALSDADAAGFARGIEEGHVFAEFALRHTHPARAKERTHEETHSILVFHPFAQALNQEQTQ